MKVVIYTINNSDRDYNYWLIYSGTYALMFILFLFKSFFALNFFQF